MLRTDTFQVSRWHYELRDEEDNSMTDNGTIASTTEASRSSFSDACEVALAQFNVELHTIEERFHAYINPCRLMTFPTHDAESKAATRLGEFAITARRCAQEYDVHGFNRELQACADQLRRLQIPPPMVSFTQDLASKWHQRMNDAGWLSLEVETIRLRLGVNDQDRLVSFDATSASLQSGRRITRLEIREALIPIALTKDEWHTEPQYQMLEQAEIASVAQQRELQREAPVVISAGPAKMIGMRVGPDGRTLSRS
jgi:hypothetical protein